LFLWTIGIPVRRKQPVGMLLLTPTQTFTGSAIRPHGRRVIYNSHLFGDPRRRP
jgi:hypothetical protein